MEHETSSLSIQSLQRLHASEQHLALLVKQVYKFKRLIKKSTPCIVPLALSMILIESKKYKD